MVIFAWILWGLHILGYTAVLALTVCAILAANDGREVKLRLNPFTALFGIAEFVFLTLYLFL